MEAERFVYVHKLIHILIKQGLINQGELGNVKLYET